MNVLNKLIEARLEIKYSQLDYTIKKLEKKIFKAFPIFLVFLKNHQQSEILRKCVVSLKIYFLELFSAKITEGPINMITIPEGNYW